MSYRRVEWKEERYVKEYGKVSIGREPTDEEEGLQAREPTEVPPASARPCYLNILAKIARVGPK